MKQNSTTESISRNEVNWLGKLNIAARACSCALGIGAHLSNP